MKALQKKLKTLFVLLILGAWAAVWLYPGAWHLMHANSRIHDWAVSKNKLKPIIELTLAGAEPLTPHYNAPPMISAYLALCRKLEDPARAATIMAESNPDSIFQKLINRYNLPAELPVDIRKTPIELQGDPQ